MGFLKHRGVKLGTRFFLPVIDSLVVPFLLWAKSTWQKGLTVQVHLKTQALLDAGQPVLFVSWHGRLFGQLAYVIHPTPAPLISQSNDGEFITRVAQAVGYTKVVRGSYGRTGVQAGRQVLEALQEHAQSVLITADGPRGPRYRVKPGVVRLALMAGVPVVPVASSARWLLWRFTRSWDDFLAPLPFSPVAINFGEPITLHLADNAGIDENSVLKTLCATVETALKTLTLNMDKASGLKSDVFLLPEEETLP